MWVEDVDLDLDASKIFIASGKRRPGPIHPVPRFVRAHPQKAGAPLLQEEARRSDKAGNLPFPLALILAAPGTTGGGPDGPCHITTNSHP